MRARIATFNVHHCRGQDGAVDAERVAGLIASLDVDLLALQELDRGAPRSGLVGQPAEIQRVTGLEVNFFPTLRLGARGEYGVAVAASETTYSRFEALPRYKDEEPRGAIVGGWRGLSFVAVHLSTAAGARHRQIHRVAEIASDLATPAIVLGDFNSSPYRLGPLRTAGFRALAAGSFWRPGIDHILASEDIAGQARRIRTTLSDHPVVVAEVNY